MFDLVAPWEAKGDQPVAIKQIEEGFNQGYKRQTLLGATGTGKTFTMANMIKRVGRPTLVLCHNKTLAAQLWSELQAFFPNNAVEYFVSYYDYYQPESYVPARDLYIEKDTQINAQIERMRLSAAFALSTREDVIIVASVSCIYGLGDPEEFRSIITDVALDQKMSRTDLISSLITQLYERNDTELSPGKFRVKGDTVDIIPAYSTNIIRISLFDDVVESITELDAMNLTKIQDFKHIRIFPARNYVVSESRIKKALQTISAELDEVLPDYEMLEAHRLKQRTEFDLEMIRETGTCTSIENYSRHFDGRQPGKPPFTLLDFFPDDYLLIIDESHVSIPQVHGMWKGDKARKKNLIDYGFRLPSAYDNRPLTFEEFDKRLDKVMYVSATPGEYEREVSAQVVEQIIRPTGLLDPTVTVKQTEGQIDDLLSECQKTIEAGNRVLVTTLTKKMAEHLSEFLSNKGLKVSYLHSEIDTIERTQIINKLRAGNFDVLVGINLLREGLDIPEVELVAILDADKEGFLRNARSLIQTMGRAARNVSGRVVMYADKMTDAMKLAIAETERRRTIQQAHNEKYGITPKTISKAIPDIDTEKETVQTVAKSEIPALVEKLQQEMELAADSLNFERAIELREKIKQYENQLR